MDMTFLANEKKSFNQYFSNKTTNKKRKEKGLFILKSSSYIGCYNTKKKVTHIHTHKEKKN